MNRISRRRFLRISAPAAVSVAGSCATLAPGTIEPGGQQQAAATQVPTVGSRFQEAPGLAALASAGKPRLVEGRLPANPLIIPVVEEIGQYGGVWHRIAVGPGDSSVITNRVGGD